MLINITNDCVWGIGETAQVANSSGAVQVITPSDGGPADKAGIESKDVLLSINGKSTKGLSLYDAGDLLQGVEGSEVRPQRALAVRMIHHRDLLRACISTKSCLWNRALLASSRQVSSPLASLCGPNAAGLWARKILLVIRKKVCSNPYWPPCACSTTST